MTATGRFAKQVVIVTGASRGIGAATARLFAQEGAQVVINYNSSRDEAEDLLHTIQADGNGTGLLVQADVGDMEGCRHLLEAAEALGPVEVLVNNAAAFSRAHFLKVDMDELDHLWDVNVRGVYYLSQITAQRMAERKRGNIVHVSSILARLAVPFRTVYCMSKGAIESLTRAMALDLAEHNIRVNAVSPGLIETDAMLAGFPDAEFLDVVRRQIPSKRFGTPQEIAQAILYLASAEASYINGTILAVDSALGAREAGPSK